jgi:hypothetical protein
LVDETNEATFPEMISDLISFRRVNSEDSISRGALRAQLEKQPSESDIREYPGHSQQALPSPRDPNLRRWYDRTVQNQNAKLGREDATKKEHPILRVATEGTLGVHPTHSTPSASSHSTSPTSAAENTTSTTATTTTTTTVPSSAQTQSSNNSTAQTQSTPSKPQIPNIATASVANTPTPTTTTPTATTPRSAAAAAAALSKSRGIAGDMLDRVIGKFMQPSQDSQPQSSRGASHSVPVPSPSAHSSSLRGQATNPLISPNPHAINHPAPIHQQQQQQQQQQQHSQTQTQTAEQRPKV